MRRQGLRGVMRGKLVRTAISDDKAPYPLDRVNRQFRAGRPNVAFVIDVFARRIVGWRVSSSMRTGFALDALNRRSGHANQSGTAA